MLSTLDTMNQIAAGDSYYNDDSDADAASIGDAASDAGSNEDAGDVLQSDAPLLQVPAAAAAAAPAGAPIASGLPASAKLSAHKSVDGAMAAGAAASGPVVKFKTFNLVCNASLHGLKSETDKALFTPEVDIAKHLGGDNIRALEVAAYGYDFTGVPASLGIKVPLDLAEVEHTHLSASGPVLFVGTKLTQKEFAVPLVIYQGVENDFKAKQAINFPGVDETNVHTFMSPTPGMTGMSLVVKGSIVASQIEDLINDKIEAERVAGRSYSGPTMLAMEVPQLNSYNVDTKLATTAVNVLKGLFSATNNTISISKQLRLEAVRTSLSPQTIEKMASSAVDAWTDPHEISALLKAGAPLEAITKSKFSGTITLGIKYIETPKPAKK